jgi:hypothetical protein
VIDAVDLRLVEVSVDERVQLFGGFEVPSEGLFDDQPRPAGAVIESDLAQPRDRSREGPRRQGQIEDPVARQAVLLLQRLDARREVPWPTG